MKIAFIGHKNCIISEIMTNRLRDLLTNLIIKKNADTFLFGSNSVFNDTCYKIVTDLKKKYSHINRIYLRAENEHLTDLQKQRLFSMYEDTFYPIEAHGTRNKVYIKRNQIMINMCDKLIIYYDKNYSPYNRNSGTAIAIKFAITQKKPIINIFQESRVSQAKQAILSVCSCIEK